MWPVVFIINQPQSERDAGAEAGAEGESGRRGEAPRALEGRL